MFDRITRVVPCWEMRVVPSACRVVFSRVVSFGPVGVSSTCRVLCGSVSAVLSPCRVVRRSVAAIMLDVNVEVQC